MRNHLSFVLEQAILQALKSPPQPQGDLHQYFDNKQNQDQDYDRSETYDFLAYHDALHLIFEAFELQKGIVSALTDDCFDQAMLDLVSKPKLFSRNLNQHIEPNALVAENPMDKQAELVIANYEQVLLVKPFNDNQLSQVERLIGANNTLINNNFLFKDKRFALIQPFDLITLVNPNNVKGVAIHDAFEQNPLHPCFIHKLTPSAVMAVALNQNLSQLIGYVVHVKMLYNLLTCGNMIDHSETKWNVNQHVALQFDSVTALKLLKYRYHVDVNQDVINKIAKFDEQIKQFSNSSCCIELS